MKKEGSKKDNWWVWVLAIIGVILLFVFLQEEQKNKELENTAKSAVQDANYCRSKAAEYGMQGDAIFHQVYNDCMDIKGW